MKSSLKRVLVAGSALAGLGVAAVGIPTSASASGELQVTVHTNYSDSIQVWGTNQYGNEVNTDWIATPHAWTRVNGWWWRGSVSIHNVGRHNGRTIDQWTTCNIVPGGTPRFADCWAI
ncbi:hypothetical protein ACIQ9Q_40475 [Streptomyces sp. NPDC094438]|uniref:hypothetical protein n=1 Tax=Streptomyces sp. NPDC094438 TaxID=3366061 RepID=UPI00382A79E6